MFSCADYDGRRDEGERDFAVALQGYLSNKEADVLERRGRDEGNVHSLTSIDEDPPTEAGREGLRKTEPNRTSGNCLRETSWTQDRNFFPKKEEKERERREKKNKKV